MKLTVFLLWNAFPIVIFQYVFRYLAAIRSQRWEPDPTVKRWSYPDGGVRAGLCGLPELRRVFELEIGSSVGLNDADAARRTLFV